MTTARVREQHGSCRQRRAPAENFPPTRLPAYTGGRGPTEKVQELHGSCAAPRKKPSLILSPPGTMRV